MHYQSSHELSFAFLLVITHCALIGILVSLRVSHEVNYQFLSLLLNRDKLRRQFVRNPFFVKLINHIIGAMLSNLIS
jgi:threonine/homoserine/homoserine lactone efflux protein